MAANYELDRRKFMRGVAMLGAAAPLLSGDGVALEAGRDRSPDIPPGTVPMKTLGRTGVQVSAMGLGGYHLGSAETDQAAAEIVAKALDYGVTFFDNAWEYHDGLSEERVGKALRGKRDRAFVMTKVCTHGRDKKLAMRMLEESLRRLQTDHLDLWQIHEVVYDNDPDLIFAADGAAEALLAAKQQGKVRFVGFTGHKDPEIHLKMLSHDFPFDTVQMPLNCCDATFRSFETQVLAEANRRGIAALGMKSLGGSGELVRHGAVTPEQGLRYAMSLPVATTISGVDSMQVLDQNLQVAVNFKSLAAADMQALREQCRPLAGDGRLELFKMTTKYDGKIGREQHHFPTVQDLPL
ncbi:MAG TPA: aldo/keto reductase [Candidatus Sulfotelmatobacter sp.]|jgi:aryl-alcohol dehydrogenase-like predicted oxidoreductase